MTGIMRALSETVVVRGALALLAVHLVIALALTPPWQQPDEPTHVAAVEAQVSRLSSVNQSDPGREAEILQSMAQYYLWTHRHLGGETPSVIAKDFLHASAAGPAQVGSPAPSGVDIPTYALAAGRILSWLPRVTVVDDLYWLRAFSAIAGLVTLWVAWRGARECLGTLGGATVATLLALHPQFAIVSTAASPDALVNLAGACVWWQAVLTLKRPRVLSLALMWAAAILATSVDRMGAPLLAFALVVSGATGIVRVGAWTWHSALIITTTTAAGLAAAWWFSAFVTSSRFSRALLGNLTPEPGLMTWDSFARLTWLIHQSWWFSPGWGRYALPALWIAVVATVTVSAVTGAARLLVRPGVDAPIRKFVVLAAIGIVLQLAAVFTGIYLRLGVGPQGRYLFPVLVPALVILWSGLAAWVPPPRRAHAAAALVLLLALLDAAAWLLVTVPAYYDSL